MAQPGQPQVPPRTFSPAQHSQLQNQNPQPHSPSPGAQQPGFALPSIPHQNQGAPVRPPLGIPTGRPAVPAGRPASFNGPPSQSQPASPYSAASPSFPTSPSVSTPTNMPSPSYQNLQPAPAQQSPHFPPPSYANGGPATNSNANHPPPRPTHIPLNAAPPAPLNMSAPPTPNAPGTPGAAQQYTSQAFVPAINAPNTPGAMGPPTGRPQREYDYDVTDSLLGTGVNIRDEENALAEYYAGSFGQDARTGLPANAPGSRASFYGAGFANQPGAPTNVSQQEFEAAEAERAWNESAARLSAIRAVEANDSMLSFPQLHARMEKIAESHGLTLNLDNKSNTQGVNVQKSRNPAEYPTPKVTVTTKTGPDGALVSVYGSVLPPDSFLIDQMALLSLGVKQRLRGLIQEADKMATHRQQTSHGVVPMCFADDGIPLEAVGLFDPKDAERLGGASNSGGGGGAGGDDNPRKRRLIVPFLSCDVHALLMLAFRWPGSFEPPFPVSAGLCVSRTRGRRDSHAQATEAVCRGGSRSEWISCRICSSHHPRSRGPWP